MIPLEQLTSECAANEALFDGLVEGTLRRPARARLEAHLGQCAACRRQWRWVQWSSETLLSAITKEPETPLDQVRADAVARTYSKLARALDQVGKRLLIECGGARHRIVMGEKPSLKKSMHDAEYQLRTLDQLERCAMEGAIRVMVRRVLKHKRGTSGTIRLAHDLLNLVCELDGDYPQPILRRLQLPTRGRSLPIVERGVEQILTLTREPLLRGLAILELASSQIEQSRDLLLAASTLRYAQKQNGRLGYVIGNAEIVAFMAEGTTRSVFERRVTAAFRSARVHTSRRDRRDLLRMMRASLNWLRAESLLEAGDQRFMSAVFARTLS